MSSLKHIAAGGSHSDLEDSWLEELGGSPDADVMTAALESLLRSGDPGAAELAGSLLSVALEELEENGSPALEPLLKSSAELFDSSERLRSMLLDHLRDEYLTYEPLERMIDLSGLGRGGSIRRGWRELQQLLRYRKGAFVLHERFGPGEILRIRRASATVDFQKASDHDMELKALLDTTRPIAEDSLMVLRWKRPRELAGLVEQRPDRLLEKLLDENGGEVSENLLTPLLEGLDVRPRTLWKGLRGLAKASPNMMDLGDSIGRIPSEDLAGAARRALLDSREPLADRVNRLEAILSSDHDRSIAGAAAGELARKAAGLKTPETGARWEAVWLLARAAGKGLELPPVEGTAARAVRALGEISRGDCARDYVRALAETLPGQEAVSLLRQLGSKRREWLLDALASGRIELAVSALRDLAGDMGEPGLYIWAVTQALGRGLAAEAGLEVNGGLAAGLLEAIGYARATEQRRAARLLEGDLSEQLHAHLSDLDTRRLASLSQKLEKSAAAHESGLLLRVRRELSNRRRSSTSARRRFWEGDAIFASTEAIARRRRQAERLEKVEIPAAAEAVGEAASHGDLSENAEYEAAMERRDMLLSRLRDFKEELRRVRPYPVSDVSSSMCSPGTAVVLAGEDGERVRYRLVGPLDAAPEKGAVNYLSPVGSVLLGRRRGEEVTLPGKRQACVVEEIEVLPEVRGE